MESIDIEKLKYPIGKYTDLETITPEHITAWLEVIKTFPQHIRAEVEELPVADLQKRYRPGGWTIHQVVHHCSDSHMNALVRFKLALTEDNPTIKPYAEAAWAELPDTLEMPISVALQLLDSIHAKMVVLINSFTTEQLQRTFVHPEYMRTQTLAFTVGLYAWHCNHHLAHVKLAKANSL